MAIPYFTDDLVSLYLGDCREVTEWLSAEVLVTDPPYGRGTDQSGGTRRQKPEYRTFAVAGDKDATLRDTALGMWGGRPAVAFGDLMLGPPAGTKQVLVYEKGETLAGDRPQVSAAMQKRFTCLAWRPGMAAAAASCEPPIADRARWRPGTATRMRSRWT